MPSQATNPIGPGPATRATISEATVRSTSDHIRDPMIPDMLRTARAVACFRSP